jgi:hypothetical protein
MQGKFGGPEAESGPVLKQRKKKFVKEHPTTYSCQMTDESGDSERVKIERRELSTWISHALMTEFWKKCEVRFMIIVSVSRTVTCIPRTFALCCFLSVTFALCCFRSFFLGASAFPILRALLDLSTVTCQVPCHVGRAMKSVGAGPVPRET